MHEGHIRSDVGTLLAYTLRQRKGKDRGMGWVFGLSLTLRNSSMIKHIPLNATFSGIFSTMPSIFQKSAIFPNFHIQNLNNPGNFGIFLVGIL